MADPAKHGLDTLTEKEKQTLRLIVRGHDAKSVARSLGLSVHTVNERLRDARRKVAVSSSREAARLLFEAEGSVVTRSPESVGDTTIGDDATLPLVNQTNAPDVGARRWRLSSITFGVVLMTLTLVMVALAALQVASSSTPPPPVAEASNPAVVDAARQFLALVDQSRWADAYRLTGSAFRKQNTLEVWTRASEQMRTMFGAAGSRRFISEEELPAVPTDHELVRFRTDFANKPGTSETVTLEREDGSWRVAGVIVG